MTSRTESTTVRAVSPDSTILPSQLPVVRWHEQIGDPTAAEGILDRLVHNAHRIEMRGDSMRKKRGGAS
jgi:DNA replication protein DnaC